MSELQSLYGQFSSPSQLMAQLNQYQNVQYWASINTSAYQPQTAGSDAQKKADDAWVKSLAAQQQLLQQDAANLQRLQTTASNTQGQVQAIEAASQIAAQTNEQLMEIRALMISEQNALVARQQTLANDESMKQAASDKFLGVGTQYQPAPEEVLKAP
jgi:P-type conjugative transfer protein TrbJ